MATLVSPGVSVSIIDESFYASAGAGTVPLIVLATAQDKFQPGSSTAIATGTTKANAGKLRLVTSQRDALQTFGIPNFYNVGCTPQYSSELNEQGLFALYEYLGIANSAYVLRADIDLNALSPRTVAPTGLPVGGDYWLDLSQTTFGVFSSNGDSNSSYAWGSNTPLVISSKANLQRIVQGLISNPSPLPSANIPLITVTGNLYINNIAVPCLQNDTLLTVINRINSSKELNSLGISATAFVRHQKFYKTGTQVSTYGASGDVYNLRIISSDSDLVVNLEGSTPSILTNLGFASVQPVNVVLPTDSFGSAGDFAVNTVPDEVSNTHVEHIWQKISIVTLSGTKSWWFLVGSTDTEFPGWGWREATPRIITGSVPNPTFVIGQSILITIGSSSQLGVTVPIPTTGETTLDAFIRALNTVFNNYNTGIGLNAMAKKSIVGGNNYLQIINYDATNIWIHDNSTYTGVERPLGNAGVSGSTAFFGSVTGTTDSPTFTGASMYVASGTVVNPGVNYAVGNVLDINGGNATTEAQMVVESIKAVNYTGFGPSNGGSGYAPRDTITISGPTNVYRSPVILRVESVGNNGAITSVSILQAGQLVGNPPSNPVTVTSTSGSGTGATITMFWGVSTAVLSSSPNSQGDYNVFPTNPVTADTNASGSGCTLNLVKGFNSANSFKMTMTPGVTKTVYVTDTSLSSVVQSINDAWSEYTSININIASIVTSSGQNYLKISSPNGTSFTLEDVSGTPLYNAGINVGTTFGKQLVYKGYYPSLTVPNSLRDLAPGNVWINTSPQNRGSSFVVKQYINGIWTRMNIVPNTGNIPMYSSETFADQGFGPLKGIGSIFLHYNSNGTTPANATMILKRWDGTTWQPLIYTASVSTPNGPATDGTYWYNTNLMIDIMVSDGQYWKGYKRMYPGTDPNGPILDASAPITQSTGAPLVDYDIWVDTHDVENYPKIYRWSQTQQNWILIDNTDHSSSAGIIFADARPNATCTANGSIDSSMMVLSNTVDPDAPDARLYPDGLLLFNTRYSTNNVKVWKKNYFPVSTYPNVTWRDRWVTESGNKPDGSPYMGHWSQRAVVVRALQAVINSNQDVRAEENAFNLIATPGYVECLGEMKTLNSDKKNFAFIIGDTPARLDPSGISIQDWANNANKAPLDGPDGLTTTGPFIGLYYPWGLASDLNGNNVFVPPSVAALRTYAYNDQVAYPWFAPAGYNRGLISGIESVGYLTTSGDYEVVHLSQGQRNVLYTNRINPIANIPGRGLIIYGQKTLNPVASALDRVNVARLVNYLNYQLEQLALPFLFEPNDDQTRKAVTTTFTSFMGGMVGQRAVYDFAVVCDTTNNTPARIDRNELWIDIAIKPEKAIEFIYIPVRLLNTGTPMPGAVRGTIA